MPNHPAPGQHDEPLLIFELLDDPKRKAPAHAEEPPHLYDKLFELSGVTAIGENHQQAQQAVAEEAQEHLGTVAILHARWCDHHAEKQAVGGGQRVALAAFDLLPAS